MTLSEMEYRATGDECRKAWFEYRAFMEKFHPNTQLRSVDFVAGWNSNKQRTQNERLLASNSPISQNGTNEETLLVDADYQI